MKDLKSIIAEKIAETFMYLKDTPNGEFDSSKTIIFDSSKAIKLVDEIMEEIEKTRKWITEDPLVLDNFICDLGAEGVCLGWFDGKSWVKLWTKEPIKVYGWINIPGHKI